MREVYFKVWSGEREENERMNVNKAGERIARAFARN